MLGDIGQLINPKIGMIDGEQILSIYNRRTVIFTL